MNERFPGAGHSGRQAGRAIPEYDLGTGKERMSTAILEALATQQQRRILVNIAGASASGKGQLTEQLRLILSAKGKRVLVLSTDDYYKGISRLVVERLLEHFPRLAQSVADLVRFIRSVTGGKEFAQKPSAENIEAIARYLESAHPGLDTRPIRMTLQDEFRSPDFEAPDAVDLAVLGAAARTLKDGGETVVPEYSMVVSEPVGGRMARGQDFDVIVIEGIHALHDALLEDSDLTAFVIADVKTLLMRRLRRDVLGARTSFPPDEALWMTLEVVLPAYRKYIEPTKRFADIVVRNSFAEIEGPNHYEVQDKIPLRGGEIQSLEAQWGPPEDTVSQDDYYFTNEEDDQIPDHVIRVRVENGALKDLVHKGPPMQRDDGKMIRPAELYIRKGQFGIMRYRNIDEVTRSFECGGFRVAARLVKERRVYHLGGVEIVFDDVEGLGSYLRLSTDNQLTHAAAIDAFKERFGLTGRPPVGPYIDEYRKGRASNRCRRPSQATTSPPGRFNGSKQIR